MASLDSIKLARDAFSSQSEDLEQLVDSTTSSSLPSPLLSATSSPEENSGKLNERRTSHPSRAGFFLHTLRNRWVLEGLATVAYAHNHSLNSLTAHESDSSSTSFSAHDFHSGSTTIPDHGASQSFIRTPATPRQGEDLRFKSTSHETLFNTILGHENLPSQTNDQIDNSDATKRHNNDENIPFYYYDEDDCEHNNALAWKVFLYVKSRQNEDSLQHTPPESPHFSAKRDDAYGDLYPDREPLRDLSIPDIAVPDSLIASSRQLDQIRLQHFRSEDRENGININSKVANVAGVPIQGQRMGKTDVVTTMTSQAESNFSFDTFSKSPCNSKSLVLNSPCYLPPGKTHKKSLLEVNTASRLLAHTSEMSPSHLVRVSSPIVLSRVPSPLLSRAPSPQFSSTLLRVPSNQPPTLDSIQSSTIKLTKTKAEQNDMRDTLDSTILAIASAPIANIFTSIPASSPSYISPISPRPPLISSPTYSTTSTSSMVSVDAFGTPVQEQIARMDPTDIANRQKNSEICGNLPLSSQNGERKRSALTDISSFCSEFSPSPSPSLLFYYENEENEVNEGNREKKKLKQGQRIRKQGRDIANMAHTTDTLPQLPTTALAISTIYPDSVPPSQQQLQDRDTISVSSALTCSINSSPGSSASDISQVIAPQISLAVSQQHHLLIVVDGYDPLTAFITKKIYRYLRWLRYDCTVVSDSITSIVNLDKNQETNQENETISGRHASHDTMEMNVSKATTTNVFFKTVIDLFHKGQKIVLFNPPKRSKDNISSPASSMSSASCASSSATKDSVGEDELCGVEFRDDIRQQLDASHCLCSILWIEILRKPKDNEEGNEKEKEKEKILQREYSSLSTSTSAANTINAIPIPLGSISESELVADVESYVKIIGSSQLECVGIRGYVLTKIVFFLSNLQFSTVPIFFSRHGRSQANVLNQVGTDAPLAPAGIAYAKRLALWLLQQPELNPNGNQYVATLEQLGDCSPGCGNNNSNVNSCVGDGEDGQSWEYKPEIECRGSKHTTTSLLSETQNVGCLDIYCSHLQRTIETADTVYGIVSKKLRCRVVKWRALSEISAGTYDGMTYDEIAENDPCGFAERSRDKLNYKYPQGESYKDVIDRVERVIFQLEHAETPVIVIAHQAVIRCLYGYFMDYHIEQIPHLDVPLHKVIKIVPHMHATERFIYDIT